MDELIDFKAKNQTAATISEARVITERNNRLLRRLCFFYLPVPWTTVKE